MPSIPVHVSLKEKQREERERLIVQTAEEVLLEKGFYETSMEEIAARVGISKGTIYLHFKSKDELVTAIIQQNLYVFRADLDAAITQHTTARGKFEAILTYLYQKFMCHNTQFLTSIYSGVELQHKLKEQKNLFREVMDFLLLHIKKIIEDGKAAGEIDPSIATPVIMRAFFSLITPRSYDVWLEQHDDLSLSSDELIAQLGRIFFDGIAQKAD
ncbi:TetR family transcriptional regulator [Dictyobacter alpinus]|uniref:TetR family transcriptional regulator n=1 Tax=Dictyobacter alpinus TaxID=2014873 RepID=A0A402BI75_9CHLR|nr:TetR/AcrR family transcriptional regulator [Dictyobacter alpinus]GCE31049.1 TetR family transcriptional regulator [Dictyobacter alpinus]